MKRSLILALAAALACEAPSGAPAGSGGPSAADAIRGGEIQEYLKTLSSDEFGGRGPGQAGGDLASQYVADHFREFGLAPVDGGYFQNVPMIGTTSIPGSVALSFEVPNGRVAPIYLDDFVLNAGDPEGAPVDVSGEMVFVGYGIDAPEHRWNDFAGMDMAGKILLILVNDPPAPPDEPDLFGGRAMTYYGRWTYKYEEAARQGALGALIIHETEPAGYPWSVVRGGWSGEQFALPPDPSGPAPVPFLGWVSHDAAARALALADFDLSELEGEAAQRGFTPVPTGITAHATVRSTVRRVETRNVVGLLKGSERPDEVVTLTSHYDHFGIGEPIDGDSIYNGAYDNASGTALLMTMAHAFAEMDRAPARSLMFISTAAEEQGLLGSEWYVQSPLLPLDHTVAEINLDGANLWGETDDVIVFGAERSELGAFVKRRAAEMKLVVMPDAEPEKGFFFRSDHFPFARAGVPSLYVEHGREFRGRPEGWGQQIMDDYTAHRYHAPSDEYSEDFVYDGAVQQGRLIFLTALDIANDDTWPNWFEGGEFKAARDRMMKGR